MTIWRMKKKSSLTLNAKHLSIISHTIQEKTKLYAGHKPMIFIVIVQLYKLRAHAPFLDFNECFLLEIDGL